MARARRVKQGPRTNVKFHQPLFRTRLSHLHSRRRNLQYRMPQHGQMALREPLLDLSRPRRPNLQRQDAERGEDALLVRRTNPFSPLQPFSFSIFVLPFAPLFRFQSHLRHTKTTSPPSQKQHRKPRLRHPPPRLRRKPENGPGLLRRRL